MATPNGSASPLPGNPVDPDRDAPELLISKTTLFPDAAIQTLLLPSIASVSGIISLFPPSKGRSANPTANPFVPDNALPEVESSVTAPPSFAIHASPTPSTAM